MSDETDWDDIGRYSWAQAEETRRQVLREQLEMVLHPDTGVEGAKAYPYSDDPDQHDLVDAQYLYTEGRLLVRDEDVATVLAELDEGDSRGGDPVRGEGQVAGLTQIALNDWSTTEACERLERTIGEGAASPDHIFYVCISHCCPADEPTPATAQRPVPDLAGLQGTGAGVKVTAIDTGLDARLTQRHDWLTGVTGVADPQVDPATGAVGPYGGHGSFSAGVIRTMAPEADVHVINLLDRAGAVTESSIVAAMYRALDDAPDVITMSAGTYTRNNVPPLSFEVFYRRRLQHSSSTAFIAAAGNDSTRTPFWPAAFAWCTGVGAIDERGDLAPFSNFGPWVDVFALGVDMVNAYPDGSYTYSHAPHTGRSADFPTAMARWSGTSFSTPLMAGITASRVSRTGQSGRSAARTIQHLARRNSALGGLSRVDPRMADLEDPRYVPLSE